MGIYNLGGGGGAPELQAKEATPLITNAQQIILPDEGYDGLSKVTVNPMPTGVLKTPTVNSIGYVSSGVQTAGYFDTSATSGLQLSTQAAKTITPTTYSQTAVASGKYTTGAVTVAGDTNLIPENILINKKIYGVTGTMMGYLSITPLAATIDSYSMSVDISISDINRISGIRFCVLEPSDISISRPQYPYIISLVMPLFFDKESFDIENYKIIISRFSSTGIREEILIPVSLSTNKYDNSWRLILSTAASGYQFDAHYNYYIKRVEAIITS